MSRLVNPLAPRRALPQRIRQIKDWVRQLHALDDDVTVSVTELACREEGCPDIETVIGIMRPRKKIETLRVHKPIAEVELEDLGAARLMNLDRP